MGTIASQAGCSCEKGACCKIVELTPGEDGEIRQVGEATLRKSSSAVSESSAKRRVQLRSATKEYRYDEEHQKLLTQNEEGETGTLGDLDWLNWLVASHWTYFKNSTQKLMKEELEPMIQAALPPPLNIIEFKEIHLGDRKPVLGPIQTFFETQNGFEGLNIDTNVTWLCDGKIILRIGAVEIGVENFSLKGSVHLRLRPLLETLPVVGGMQITMLSPPMTHWTFTGGLALGLKMDIVTRTLRKVLADILSDMLVVPNQIFVHWLEAQHIGLDLDTLEFPEPEFLMRLGVLDVTGLAETWSLCGSRSSEGYAMLQVGAQTFQAPAKRQSRDDGWYDILVFHADQHVHVEVFQQSLTSQGDHLGVVKSLTVQKLLQDPDSWWSLTPQTPRKKTTESETDKESPSVHLSAQFFLLTPSAASVPAGRGMANHQAFIFVHLRGCRGVIAEECRGARIRFKWEDAEQLSKSSFFQPVEDDATVSVSTQKMVEYLWENSKLSSHKDKLKHIVEVTGMPMDEISAIVYQRPTFTMRWGQLMILGIQDADAATVNISLELPSLRGVSYASLEQPITLEDLMAQPDWVMDRHLVLKPDLAMSGGTIMHTDSVELNARFKLRCVSIR
ncbi:ESYT3 [Symbiodinium sp. CCMP2592]|nr:ESYT3 [Symbiodinium sp. CCMP2592]